MDNKMTEWKDNLGTFFAESEKDSDINEEMNLTKFIESVVLPAFQEISDEMSRHGRHVTQRHTEAASSLIVQHHGEEELRYRIAGQTFPTRILPCTEIRFRERAGNRRISVEGLIRSGSDYQMADITKDEIIEDFVKHYTQRVQQ
jgi:hypothetical protein